jgi:alpha/beta superfamily hydrolase
VANLLVRPVAERWFMQDDELAALQLPTQALAGSAGSFDIGRGGLDAKAALAWLAVGVPMLWGAWVTLSKARVLFR